MLDSARSLILEVEAEANYSSSRTEIEEIMAENKEDRLQLLAELRGHTNRVWTVAWSPSGKYLASCGGDKTIRIWSKDASDDSKWVCTSVLDGVHTRTVRCVAWSPCGTKIASSGFDGQVGIWEYDTDDAEWQCIAALEGHQNEVKWVSWSNDGSLIATCSRDKTACIWEADASRDFDCVSWLHGHSQDVKYAMWSTFGENVLLTASYDNSIKVWTEEDDDWYCTETLSEHTSTVWQLAMDKVRYPPEPTTHSYLRPRDVAYACVMKHKQHRCELVYGSLNI